jgi:hypothetical protein
VREDLDWYLSGVGPRVQVSAALDISGVARAIVRWVYDPDDPRQASRDIKKLTRETVALAARVAVDANPVLLSPKRRERLQAIPAAADQRLTTLARRRLRELYPEIERVEESADLSYFAREHPAVRKVLSNVYPGSGAGRPRVPDTYPLMLTEVSRGLLDISSAAGRVRRAELERLSEDALDCYDLSREVAQSCETVRTRGRELCKKLRSTSDASSFGLTGRDRAEAVEASLEQGKLPYANSEILPVGPYGMEPHWNLDPLLREFAVDNQDAYEEIDRYGGIAMGWARRVAIRARDLLPPHVPDQDD